MNLRSVRLPLLALGFSVLMVFGQGPAPGGGGQDEVVAKVDGKPVTLRELRSFLTAMPAQNRAQALQSPENFLRQYALMNRLSAVAEERKLDQASPYKEQIEYQRRVVLSTAGLNALSQEVVIPSVEARSYYEANKSEFAEVKTKVIYIPFLNALPKPGEPAQSMPESEALALAEKIVADVRGGADFVAKVKEYSKDEGSRNKDGDFAALKKSDNIPQAVKDVIFEMKEGEVSDPVRQPNGFYIFKVMEVKVPSFDEVAATLDTKLHSEKFRKKMDALRDSIEITDLKAELLQQ